MTIETATVDELWEYIAEQLASHKDPYSTLNAIYEVELTDSENSLYQLDFANGLATIHHSDVLKPDCTLKMKMRDFKKLLYGDLNTTTSFMTGKLKVNGNIGLALKLEGILKNYNFKS